MTENAGATTVGDLSDISEHVGTSIVGDDGESNHVTVTFGPTTFTIRDSSARVAAAERSLPSTTCTHPPDGDVHTLVCTLVADQHETLGVDLGDEDDQLRINDPGHRASAAWLSDGPGDDTIHAAGETTHYFPGPGDDVYFGGPARDLFVVGHDFYGYLVSGGGNDRLYGGGGNDILAGGSGNDRLYGGPGNDRLFGNQGNDAIFGGPGNDLLVSGSGHDLLVGGPGHNRLDRH